MASFWCLCCLLETYITPLSNVSVVDFEHVFVCWVFTVKGNTIGYYDFRNVFEQLEIVSRLDGRIYMIDTSLRWFFSGGNTISMHLYGN